MPQKTSKSDGFAIEVIGGQYDGMFGAEAWADAHGVMPSANSPASVTIRRQDQLGFS